MNEYMGREGTTLRWGGLGLPLHANKYHRESIYVKQMYECIFHRIDPDSDPKIVSSNKGLEGPIPDYDASWGDPYQTTTPMSHSKYLQDICEW